jgi:flagellar biosynthesis/type III secretory pathway protein FliH
MNSLLAYSWGAASIKTEKELNEFYEKFVVLQEQSSDEIVPNAYGIVEDLLEENLTKIFEHLTKIAMTHRSRILDKLALEVAAPIIEKTSHETYEKGVQEGRQEGRQEGKYAQALKTAEKCLLKGMSIKDTVELTELPIKTVQELAKKLNK